MIEQRLKDSLEQLETKSALRRLKTCTGMIDFCSNDYLGLSFSKVLHERVLEKFSKLGKSGSGGSRLLSGNHPLMEDLEIQLKDFHQSEAALLFNSGYNANLSLFACIPQRGDVLLYDCLVHASIHDGMRICKAEIKPFKHNNCEDLQQLLEASSNIKGALFVAVESLYSMDGDLAPLTEIAELCQKYGASLIVDEAHATGVFGYNGVGRVQELGLQNKVFARLHTFGKALGGHGAAILGSNSLKQYLVNFARPLIFSTALSLYDIIHSSEAYRMLEENGEELRLKLQEKIHFFNTEIDKVRPNYRILDSISPIQGILIPGNENALKIAAKLQENGYDVRAIRYPSVAAGTERLRICLHSYNSEAEISNLIKFLQ